MIMGPHAWDGVLGAASQGESHSVLQPGFYMLAKPFSRPRQHTCAGAPKHDVSSTEIAMSCGKPLDKPVPAHARCRLDASGEARTWESIIVANARRGEDDIDKSETCPYCTSPGCRFLNCGEAW